MRIALGALVVAAAAQVTVPVPFSPVPMTLQPLAVLVVGGLLGAAGGVGRSSPTWRWGSRACPSSPAAPAGCAHLVGPTGGYLLAFPVAAGVVGALVGRWTPASFACCSACALGMVVIHVGGVAQLALLGGDAALAFRVGFVPFFTGDLLKIGLAAAVILGLRPKARGVN